MCVCGFSTTPNDSLIPAGCPTIQLNSDTIYMEREGQIPQVKSSVIQDCPPIQMPILSPGCHLNFWLSSFKSEVVMTPFLGFLNLLEHLTELRKPVYSLEYWFITKDTNQQPDEEIQKPRSQTKKILSLWSLGPKTLACGCVLVYHPGHSPNPVTGFLWRLHYKGTIE